MRAFTSIQAFNKEVKGRTNWQNEIVMQGMRRIGKPSTANEIMEVTCFFTKDGKPLLLNVVTRVLNDLREIHKKVAFEDKPKKLEDGTFGRTVHHHYLVEEGKQINLF
jgi:hypothetical protein